MITPTILALAYIGILIYLDLLPDFNLLPLGTWEGGIGGLYIADDGGLSQTLWGEILTIMSVAISMAVNALVTGLIVYRIFKAFRKVQRGSTSVEKSLGVNGGRKYRSLIFVIIESGIALFAIQLVRVILILPPLLNSISINLNLKFVYVIHQMFNVSITLVIINLYFC